MSFYGTIILVENNHQKASMKNKFKVLFICCFFSSLLFARSIYLNGVDVSSSLNQKLKKVDITIDGSGNLHIKAPHYQILEEDQYVPVNEKSNRLSKREFPKVIEELKNTPPTKLLRQEKATNDILEPNEPASETTNKEKE